MPTDARAPVADRIGPPDGAVEWPTRRPGIPFRAVLIGLLLIPVNAYVIIKTEVVWASVHSTVLSLFFNAVATLFFRLLKSHRPHFQDVALAALIVVILVMATMQAPTPADRTEYRLKDFFEPGFDLGIVGCHGNTLQRVANFGGVAALNCP